MYNIYLKKSQLLKNILVCFFFLSFIFHHTLALLFIHTYFIIHLFHYLSTYSSFDRLIITFYFSFFFFNFLPRKYFLNFRQQTRRIILRANFHEFYSHTLLSLFSFFYRFSTMDKFQSPCKLTLFV